MPRRSDHTREELQELALSSGHRQLAERGMRDLSMRKVAADIGYSVGTLYNLFSTQDQFLIALNTRTFAMWHDQLAAMLDRGPRDRIKALVRGYFEFATANQNLWLSIFDHRIPAGEDIPDEQHATRGRLTALVRDEIANALPEGRRDRAERIVPTLLNTVFGHCHQMLTGNARLMGETDPEADALERVRDALA